MAPRKRRNRARSKKGGVGPTIGPTDAGSTRVQIRASLNVGDTESPPYVSNYNLNLFLSSTAGLGRVPNIALLYTQYKVERVGIFAQPGQHVACVVRAGSTNLPSTTELLMEAADVRYMNTTTTGSQVTWYRPVEAPYTAWQEITNTSPSIQTGLVSSLSASGGFVGVGSGNKDWRTWMVVVFDVLFRGLQSQQPPSTISSFSEQELEAQLAQLRAGARWSELTPPSQSRERSTSRTRLTSSAMLGVTR